MLTPCALPHNPPTPPKPLTPQAHSPPLPPLPPCDALKSIQQHFCISLAKSFTFVLLQMHNNFNLMSENIGHSQLCQFLPHQFLSWANIRQTKELSSPHQKCQCHERPGKTEELSQTVGDKGATTTKCDMGLQLGSWGSGGIKKKLMKCEGLQLKVSCQC